MLCFVLYVLVFSFSPSHQSSNVSSNGRSYNSNSYVVSSQQYVDPSTSGVVYNSQAPQSYQPEYTVKDPQSYNTDYNAYYSQDSQNYDTPNYKGDTNSNYNGFSGNNVQSDATNNTPYVTSDSQVSLNVNGGYKDNSVLDYGTDQYVQTYGSEYGAKTPQNDIVDYNSQTYGGYSGNNQQNYDSGNMYSAFNSTGNYAHTNLQMNDNEEYPHGNNAQSVYQYHNKFIQNRFHPTTYEEDSHTGEVVEPPTSNSRPVASQSFSQQNSDLSPLPSEPVGVQNPIPDKEPLTPPPLPNGYDYQPAPPPLPPPPPVQPSPYYYYSPPRPPSNQYLPVPTSPPHPPTPPPPPPDSATQERQVDYTYYYLGPKLWYVPLFFSIYFVLYVGALIIKAISKHKILFPQQLYNAASTVYSGRENGHTRTLDKLTAHVTRALANAAVKYLKSRTVHS